MTDDFETYMKILRKFIMLFLDDENEEDSEEDSELQTSMNQSISAGTDIERTPREESSRAVLSEDKNEESPGDSSQNKSRDATNDDTGSNSEQDQVGFNEYRSACVRYRLCSIVEGS